MLFSMELANSEENKIYYYMTDLFYEFISVIRP